MSRRFETELLESFEAHAAEACGQVLQPNAIAIDDDGTGLLSYEVKDSDPPIVCRDGRSVRAVVVTYDLKDATEKRH